MSESEEEKMVTGFDRGVDYVTMRDKLKDAYKKLHDDYNSGLVRKVIYTLIAMIQLRNGSRISEAVEAFKGFMNNPDHLDTKVMVKIAKSKTRKIKKDTGEAFMTKTRYRKMAFPVEWVIIPIVGLEEIKEFLNTDKGNLKKRVLDHLLKNYNCNTHSLRYACINYLLYTQNKQTTVVAKFVGHSNVNQLVRYTQNQEADKLFDIDI